MTSVSFAAVDSLQLMFAICSSVAVCCVLCELEEPGEKRKFRVRGRAGAGKGLLSMIDTTQLAGST